MRTNTPRKHAEPEPAEPKKVRGLRAEDDCIYCLPPVPKPGNDVGEIRPPEHECMLKRLGSWERRQVSVVLHKAGIDGKLFSSGCPVSESRAFHDCPFYEDSSAMDDGG